MSESLHDAPAAVCQNCWQELDASATYQFCPTCGVELRMDGHAVAADARGTVNPLPLDRAGIAIGRDEANDVQLDHPAVSARHARLEWREQEGIWVVVDENSARGTFINYEQVPPGPEGRPIQPETDILWIAPYAFRLVGPGANAPARFEPARLRVDAVGLVRTVRHEKTGDRIHILNLEKTPLSFRPGEFIALVGGSGAGKSTLMKALLGLAPAQEGTVYIGGRPFIQDGEARRFSAMHTVVGYVPQDDVVHHELTPLEALDYVTRFRLSPDLTREERLAYIQETLETVDMWPHRDKLISKLSGGQRKRVNIALELLARPRLLFLDEPTSGLDPGLDLSVMELLRAWATDPADPRTIILVTHATENVTSCKYVAFLASGGFVVYFGPPQKALDYFGVERFAAIYRQVGQYQMPGLATGEEEDGAAPDVRTLVERFERSREHFQYVASRSIEDAAVDAADPAVSREPPRRKLLPDAVARERFWRQLSILTPRYWKLLRRDRMNFIVLLLQGLLVAGLLWAVAQPDTFQPRGAANAQTVLFIMACAAAWLGILNATKEIVKEQDIYARERRYGLDAAAYLLSKVVVLAAIGAIQMGTMLFVIRYKVAFPEHGVLGAWSPVTLEWLITLELTLTAGLAIGLFLSAMSRTIDAATAVMFVLLLIQVMFAGLFFPDAEWADVLSIFTFSRWGLEALGTSADLNGLLSKAVGSAYQTDEAYTFSAGHLLARWAILAGYTGLFAALAAWKQARKG